LNSGNCQNAETQEKIASREILKFFFKGLLLGKFEEEGREKLLDTIQTLQVDRHALPAKSSTPNDWLFDQSVCEDEGSVVSKIGTIKTYRTPVAILKEMPCYPGNTGLASNLSSASDGRTI
jgi:hypothetical protein